MDSANFHILGTVVSGPLWSQGKNGRQTLELRMLVRTPSSTGAVYEDTIQVRFRRDPQNASRFLIPGTQAMICGSIGGRLWQGERGEKCFMDLNAETFVVIQPPQVTDADIRRPQPPAPPAPPSNTNDVPF